MTLRTQSKSRVHSLLRNQRWVEVEGIRTCSQLIEPLKLVVSGICLVTRSSIWSMSGCGQGCRYSSAPPQTDSGRNGHGADDTVQVECISTRSVWLVGFHRPPSEEAGLGEPTQRLGVAGRGESKVGRHNRDVGRASRRSPGPMTGVCFKGVVFGGLKGQCLHDP